MVDTSRLGGTIGKRVSSLVSEATVATRAKTAKITHDTFMVAQDSFFRLVGSEIRDTIGPMFAEIADHEDTPEWAKRTFNFLGRGHGQWQAFLAQNLGGQALSVGLGALLNNELTRPIGSIISTHPNSWLGVSEVVQAIARNLTTNRDIRRDARAAGVRPEDLDIMIELAQQDISAGDVIDALNRGVISEGGARTRLRRNGLTDRAVEDVLALRQMRITPQEASVLENFGVISRADGRRIASHHGMTNADYDKLALGGGQAPALGEMLEAFRRGIVGEARLDKAIAQSPIRTEWADVIKALRFVNPDTGAVLSAVTQNLLDPGTARRIVTENGIHPSHFNWLVETNGRPLSPEQAGELFNRKIMSREQVRQMFLESNIKNKYVDLIFRLAERLPPMELTVRMVREGAMSQAEGVENLRQLGFADRYARALIDLGVRESLEEARALSVSTIQELYEGRIITRAIALDALIEHGYERAAAEWILSIRDVRRERQILSGAITRVRTRYVSGKIDEREAQNALDRIGVPADARDDYMETWKVERDVSRPLLTTSQIQQAVKKGLIGPDAGYTRLLEVGYDEADATILIELAIPAQG